MPALIHEEMIRAVNFEIAMQLREAAAHENKNMGMLLSSISCGGSSTINLKGITDPNTQKCPTRSPDASCRNRHAQYPSVIIEVSYSQKRKALTTLAKDYICGSNGGIKIVIGLDLEYSDTSKRATISIWRPLKTPNSQPGAKPSIEMKEVRKNDVRPVFPI